MILRGNPKVRNRVVPTSSARRLETNAESGMVQSSSCTMSIRNVGETAGWPESQRSLLTGEFATLILCRARVIGGAERHRRDLANNNRL
jgi:hypothetical protein